MTRCIPLVNIHLQGLDYLANRVLGCFSMVEYLKLYIRQLYMFLVRDW